MPRQHQFRNRRNRDWTSFLSGLFDWIVCECVLFKILGKLEENKQTSHREFRKFYWTKYCTCLEKKIVFSLNIACREFEVLVQRDSLLVNHMIPVPTIFKSHTLSNLLAGTYICGVYWFFPMERNGAIIVLQTLHSAMKNSNCYFYWTVEPESYDGDLWFPDDFTQII